MPVLEIPYSEDLLLASGQSREELEEELRLLLATKLFEVRRLSLGKASELAGVSRSRFIQELARWKIPLVNLDDDQIRDELADA